MSPRDAWPSGSRPDALDPSAAGHRLLPHTADLIVEAWGSSRKECFCEAVRGLVASFADVSATPATGAVPFHLPAAADCELLAQVLEEVVYIMDVSGVVPVDVRAERSPDGGLAGVFMTTDVSGVESVGPTPKGIAWSDLNVTGAADRWVCRVLIDV